MPKKPTYEELEKAKLERQRVKEAHRYSENKYRRLFELVSDALFLIDKANGRILEVNRAASEMYGYTRKELLELRNTDLSAEPKATTRATQEELSVVPVRYHKKKNGTVFPVEITASHIDWHGRKAHIAAIRDISSRLKAEKALRESEEQHRSVIETAMDGFLLGDRQGRLIEVNESYCQISGYSEQELLSMSIADLEASETPDKVTTHIQKVIAQGEDLFVTKHRRKDGTIIDVEVCVQYKANNGGRFVCFVRDITERIRIKERLLQAQKMEAIGTFAGGIAHDFNNILSVIFGYTDLALDKTAEDSPIHDDLQNLYRAGMRARDLVMQILTFSRQTEQKMQPVQVNLIVKETLKFLRSSLPGSIQIRSNINSDGKVLVDPTQIHQVLMNLSSNAMHALRHNGGVMEVSLDEVHLDSNLAALHPEAVADTYMKLTVTDNGEGMSTQMIENIFDPFFSTKGKEEGTGLGLAVVHGIVKRCDGFIEVSSTPGQGSVFNVFLPLIEARAETPSEIKGPLPTGTERLLLVDDDKILVDIGKQTLERLGYQVTARTSSIEALELFKAKSDQFDLVITDLSMPNMTGDKLAMELITIKASIPIIICTGFSKMVSENRIKAMGIKGLLMKPIAKTDMALMVRKVLDETKKH